MVVIVDGVDESLDRAGICRLLVQLAEKMKVLVASRREKDITDVLGKERRLEMTEELTSSDIATHVRWMLEHDPKLKPIKDSMKTTIKTCLSAKSKGGLARLSLRLTVQTDFVSLNAI
jgi:hypothetical protein